jgi:hypothetical protein
MAMTEKIEKRFEVLNILKTFNLATKENEWGSNFVRIYLNYAEVISINSKLGIPEMKKKMFTSNPGLQ